MCGIFAILGSQKTVGEVAERAGAAASKLSHRGPDWSGLRAFDIIINGENLSYAIAHERLQIIDPNGGEQPIIDKENLRILSINGEIYNYKMIMSDPNLTPYMDSVLSGSDCESILPLWKYHLSMNNSNAPSASVCTGSFEKAKVAGFSVNRALDGDFAYVLWDGEIKVSMIARDPVGVNPLYIGYSYDGSIVVSSEIKAFDSETVEFREFPPGHFLIINAKPILLSNFDDWLNLNVQKYYNPGWTNYDMNFITMPIDEIMINIKNLLTSAVLKRLMSDVPFGFLLSGGLDSSLICSIATKLIPTNQRINTFSIGMKGSPDLIAARQVAEFLDTKHHEFEFTVEQGIRALPNVIYSLETFDVTTIRAGIPMYLLARKIKALGIKMVCTGESSDEQFGGYLYFHKAPNEEEFFRETVDKVLNLSKYDCLRANKALAAWGVEGRVPFLDRKLCDFVMSIPTKYKMILKKNININNTITNNNLDQYIEKWILRKAFEGYLPLSLLMRPKEQFSDGVGYNWINSLKQLADTKISDEEFDRAHVTFPEKTPKTKEAYYYRYLFENKFDHPKAYKIVPNARSVACSTERALSWEKSWLNMDEPSGRAVDVHISPTN